MSEYEAVMDNVQDMTPNAPKSQEPLPRRAYSLALRVLQLAREPGEYEITIIVHPDGRWQLKPPPRIEDLG